MRARFLKSLAGAVALSALLLWAFWAPPVSTQTTITQTTTSAAVADTDTSVALTSDTDVSAGTYLFINDELLQAISEQGTSARWNVRRGQSGTTPRDHANAERVFIGPGRAFAPPPQGRDPAGTCTSSEQLYRPYINVATGHIFDCEQGVWMRWLKDSIYVRDYTVRDQFEGGQTIMQDDGTAKSLADTEENFVYGSPLGAIEYREDVAKTASSWIAINGVLEISADDAAESVEIVVGASSDAALNQMFEVGTSGGCIAMMVTVSAITMVDELHIGFRQNEAFQDVAAYAGYDDWAVIGLVDNAGDLDIQDEEAGAGTQNDDTGVTWAAGERRALKVCLSKAGVPTFYYTAATPDATRPQYIQATATNTGDALTAGDGMVPFIVYTGAGVAGTIQIDWIEITRLP